MNEQALPSRTSIMVAAARAVGAREPDEKVRNPDFLAEELIGPDERALIHEHPLGQALEQDLAEASRNPEIFFFVWMMLMRTRFIDEALQRAVEGGTRQVVILGAGFDSRAYRFQSLLKDCSVFEIDAPATQAWKKRRVVEALGGPPPNLTYASVDFARENLNDALEAAGHRADRNTFFTWEGVSMYVPEDGVRETLRTVVRRSAPGSSLVMDYTTSAGIEMMQANHSAGMIALMNRWGEPWVFGVPDDDGTSFFSELGFDATPSAINDPRGIGRFMIRSDGTVYGAGLFEKLRADAVAKAEATGTPLPPPPKPSYWLAELLVRRC